MRNVRVGDPTDFNPLPLHYEVAPNNKNVVTHYLAGEDEVPRLAVTFNYDTISELLAHHMSKLDAGGTLDIAGHQVPVKVVAAVYLDAIHTLMQNHQVRPNLVQIKADLCPSCTPVRVADAALAPEALTPEGVTHG